MMNWKKDVEKEGPIWKNSGFSAFLEILEKFDSFKDDTLL